MISARASLCACLTLVFALRRYHGGKKDEADGEDEKKGVVSNHQSRLQTQRRLTVVFSVWQWVDGDVPISKPLSPNFDVTLQ